MANCNNDDGFVGELDVRFCKEPIDGKHFMVLAFFSYVALDGEVYSVPRLTMTDFATTKIFRSIIPAVGKYGMCAVLHDHQCDKKTVSRKLADRLFLEAMKRAGVGWFKRRIMYAGVRSYSLITRKK